MNVGSNSRTVLILVCLCVMLLIWGVGFGLDRILVKEGVTSTGISLTSNGLTGIVAALFFYSYAVGNNEREHRRVLQERLRTIDDMNHHIRNALQVIKFEASSDKYERSVERIRDSVGRIEWALREILPQYAPPPNPPRSEERREDQGK